MREAAIFETNTKSFPGI